MKCNYSRLLNRYLDNELSYEDKDFMVSHLQGCAICRKELKYLDVLKQNISKDKIDTDPEFFWQALKVRFVEKEGKGAAQPVVLEFGNWAKRLIPVPIVIGIATVITLNLAPIYRNPVDEYLFSNNNSSIFDLFE
jgi:hypothetical protein